MSSRWRPRPLLGLLVSLALVSACAPAASTAEPGVEPKSDPEPETGKVSFMDNAVYAPDPDPKLLQQTKAAHLHRTDGTSVIGFCVDVQGQTSNFEVIEPFPGDPQIDAILIDTIATWRFEPFMRDGQPIKTCTQKTFRLKFAARSPTDASPGSSEPLEPVPDSLSRDVCVHLLRLATAPPAQPIAEADTESFIRGCLDGLETQRKKIGEQAFEQRARCILTLSTFEELERCKQ